MCWADLRVAGDAPKVRALRIVDVIAVPTGGGPRTERTRHECGRMPTSRGRRTNGTDASLAEDGGADMGGKAFTRRQSLPLSAQVVDADLLHVRKCRDVPVVE